MRPCRSFLPPPTTASRWLLLAVAILALPAGGARANPVGSISATAVWGQPDFRTSDRRCKHSTSLTLCGPTQVLIDDHHNLWVADLLHSRVLMFPAGSAIAGKVFGQYGSMTTHGCDQAPPHGSAFPPAPNRYTLCQPAGIAIDQRGTLYVADSLNNRVLVFFHAAQKPAAAPADRVLGQRDFHASASNERPAGGSGLYRCGAPHPASACTLNSPMALSLTREGDLLVPDLDNHRVLLWSASALAHLRARSCDPTCFLPADRVWGQYDSFRTTIRNNPVIPAGAPSRCTPISLSTPASACTLSGPWSAAADQQGNLYVADTANNRVLAYDHALQTGRQDASRVYGQAGSFVTAKENPDGVTAASLWHPLGLALDPHGLLWVTDFDNMRLLAFPAPDGSPETTATQVLGQEGNLSANGCHLGAEGLCGPTGIAFDGAGHAVVSDGFNDRLLAFFSPPVSLARVDHLRVTRHGTWMLVRWHSTGHIRGFALYRGHRRLTPSLLLPNHEGNCQDAVPGTALHSVTLQVMLQSGQQVRIVVS